MIILPSAYQGRILYEEGWFFESLKEYDPYLEAYRDNRTQSIIGWATRQSKKVHEWTMKRGEGETWDQLERRIIKMLPEGDIWKRFGSGKAYDDYLTEQAEKARADKLRDARNNRLPKIIEEVDKIKFDHGLRARKIPGAELKGA